MVTYFQPKRLEYGAHLLHPVDVVSNDDFQSFVSIQENVERN